MKTAYLGIADSSGLRLLIPEREHAARFLVRRAFRWNAVCFWAVIDDAFYLTVRTELERGESHNALRLVQLLASDIGTVLPSTYVRDDLADTA